MADRYGSSREKTYSSRNRAIAALVQSTSNIVTTDIDGLDSAAAIALINQTATGIDSASIINLIDSDYVAARSSAGTDSATVLALIDDTHIFSQTKIKSSKNYWIQTTQPTITDVGQYWYKSDSDILYKSVPSTTLTTTMPAVTVVPGASPYSGFFDYPATYPSSATRTNISGTDALGGTFTLGTTASAWFYFEGGPYPASPQRLNKGFYYTFDSAQDLRGIIIENGNSNAGRLERIDYDDGSYADNGFPGGGTVTYYYSNGTAMGKTASANTTGNTFVDISHPTGALATRIAFSQVGDYYAGNDVFLFFAGGRIWQEIDRARTSVGLDSSSVTSLIDSSYINARIGAGTVEAIVDSAYIQLRDRFQDSAGIISIVDSAYVQARQSNVGGGGGVDSAATISLINSVIDSASRQFTYTYTASAGQTSFSGSDDNGATLAYSTGNILTFLNGILLVDSADYTATTGNSIVLNSAASLNDILNVTKFTSATSGSALSHTQYKYTTSAPATTFTGADDNSNTLSYDAGELQVHLNGILLVDSDDYTASNGTSVVLTQATDSNDVVLISVYTGGAGGGGAAAGGTDSATVISLSGELKGGMFRVNPQTLSQNVTIDSAENAHCAGPISFDSGVVLTINGNLVIS